MKRSASTPTPGHGTAWLGNFGENGALEVTCRNHGEEKGIIVNAGWGNINACPVCGQHVQLNVEEEQ